VNIIRPFFPQEGQPDLREKMAGINGLKLLMDRSHLAVEKGWNEKVEPSYKEIERVPKSNCLLSPQQSDLLSPHQSKQTINKDWYASTKSDAPMLNSTFTYIRGIFNQG
jgi:hypothetical protein